MLTQVLFLTAALLAEPEAGAVDAKTVTVTGTDSESIQAAIEQAGPGDTIRLPERTYAVHGAIQVKSLTKLEGAGQDKTVLRFESGVPSVFLSLSGCQDVEVCGMSLDGAGDPNASQGVSAGNASRLNLHHLTIRNLVKSDAFGPHAVLFSGVNPTRENGVTDSVIADCRIENIGVDASFGCGIRLSWGSSRNRVLRNVIRDTGRGGIFADNGSTDIVIQGNTVTGSMGEGLGIEVWGGCDRCVIEDNRIDHWLSFGGSDYGAARRNVIADTSGAYKLCGIEAIGSYLVLTDNAIDGGQKIGLSVSSTCKKDYAFWARNTVRNCNQWGAQFQGESTGIACHYLYQCKFLDMPVGVGEVWYPGDEGHGFRLNGNCRNFVFEQCEFSGNARLGVQCVGTNIDGLSFLRCAFRNNGGAAMAGLGGDYTAFECPGCTVEGNGNDTLPEPKPFAHRRPVAAFYVPPDVKAGQPVKFTNSSQAADGVVAGVLWDFGDGPPSTEPNPSYTYATPGTYRVTLLVWDDTGRALRAEREVVVSW